MRLRVNYLTSIFQRLQMSWNLCSHWCLGMDYKSGGLCDQPYSFRVTSLVHNMVQIQSHNSDDELNIYIYIYVWLLSDQAKDSAESWDQRFCGSWYESWWRSTGSTGWESCSCGALTDGAQCVVHLGQCPAGLRSVPDRHWPNRNGCQSWPLSLPLLAKSSEISAIYIYIYQATNHLPIYIFNIYIYIIFYYIINTSQLMGWTLYFITFELSSILAPAIIFHAFLKYNYVTC